MKEIEIYEAAIQEYRAEWKLINPQPVAGKVSGMDFLQFYLFMPVAAIGPFVSAFRTAALLRDNSAFQGNTAAWVETLLGTVFFELAAIVYQFVRLRRIWQESDEKEMPKIGTRWIIVGMVATVGAITTSNIVEVLVTALAKAKVVVPPLIPAIAIGLFVGLGVPLTTVVAGETIGRFLLELQTAKAKIQNEYQAALEDWNSAFFRSWKAQRKKRIAAYNERQKASKQTIKTEEEKRSRSEYSHWRNTEARKAEIVRYVQDHDHDHSGVEVEEIWTAVWNGRRGGKSVKYAAIKELVEEDKLEEVNGDGNRRRVRLKYKSGAAF